jgi:hypothetical protein
MLVMQLPERRGVAGRLQVTAEGERNIPTKWSVMCEVLRWDMVIPSILWEHWREEPWCHINKTGIVQLF